MSDLPGGSTPLLTDRYRTILHQLAQPFCLAEVLVDPTGQVTDCRVLETNAAFTRQATLASPVGRTLRELIGHDDAGHQTVATVARTGQAARFEQRVQHLGGHWHEVQVLPTGPAGSQQVALLFNDITARRRNEEQFRQFVLATSNTLYKMSPDWQQMLNLESQDFLTNTLAPDSAWLASYIPASDHPAVQAALEAAMAMAQPFSFEHRVIRADKSVGWASSRAVPVLDEQGRLIEWFGAASDITARKKATAVAKQHALQEQLLGAQEEERRRISESLHNGLGQLLYAAKLHLDGLPTATTHPAHREAARLLAAAIGQTRTLSHELTPLPLAEFGLAEALRTICTDLSGSSLRWKCHLVLDEAPPLPQPLQIAVYRLAQELAQNVVKHAQARHATLEVEVLPGWVVLRVEDDGCGFDPTAPANGIGLRTLRNRADLLGGTVHIASEPGKGTECQIRIPIAA
ncbi:MAG: PAS domain-containing protein [Janthinobacterium lividum]